MPSSAPLASMPSLSTPLTTFFSSGTYAVSRPGRQLGAPHTTVFLPSGPASTTAFMLWLSAIGSTRSTRAIHASARALGKRTMIGGPYASTDPQVLLPLADHVVVGEPDEVFDGIATDLERGCAKRLYVITDKPDISR